MLRKLLFISLLLLLLCIPSMEAQQFSTAGFYQVPGSGRDVFSMNPAWRFFRGSVEGAGAVGFDDSGWQVVSLPHGLDELPPEASGCINYQGEAWYRKHFILPDSLKSKRLFLHFEGIMGKSRIFVNGREEKIHYGGYLPVVIDVTGKLHSDRDNVIAVLADNSNDPAYPPGKPQETLDFTYMGGIYRDCWLVSHNDVFVTDPNFENEPAGGGVLVDFGSVSDERAVATVRTHVRNEHPGKFSGRLSYRLVSPDGKTVSEFSRNISLGKGKDSHFTGILKVDSPELWTPDSPSLYQLFIKIEDSKGNIVDAMRKRIGIRHIEFKGSDGFWLNGKPFDGPLIGANRHQDFAVVGNAVPNSIHWRDARKLRDAGFRVIRNAHCPQDPAFMDACDELGLLVIVNTPGWQFWNDAPEFAQRVYSDIRNMVRRDRNHPSVWMWEPILNETWYPDNFARRTVEIVAEEFPRGAEFVACDSEARGNEHFRIKFSHPVTGSPHETKPEDDSRIAYFTREWGDNVDNWNAHNSPSRVARGWGERPMLVQADHYASPSYPYTCLDALHRTSRQHMGGCLWHSFDHQRGYHPDPFYGGVMDAYRQPKYSYHMFRAQRPAEQCDKPFETGPMVFIAHEMTPFSSKDVTVYSNCQEVRLTFCKDGKTMTMTNASHAGGIKSPIMVFPDMYDFMTDKALTRNRHIDDVWLLAEGFIDGQLVATHRVTPARRPEKILLALDSDGVALKADGSDFVTVVASVVDANGNVRRLSNQFVRFSVEGEGSIIGDTVLSVNPAPVRWGTAPVLVRSTMTPGKIKVMASVVFEGIHTPLTGELVFESVPPDMQALFSQSEASEVGLGISSEVVEKSGYGSIGRSDVRKQLQEVERQQTEFGEKR